MQMVLARNLIQSQTRLTERFDRLLPAEFLIDGNRHFLDSIVPEYLQSGALVYDVGGGKNPVIDTFRKAQLGLRVVGLDIDGGELAAADAGLYDRTVCADITRYRGAGDADLVICQALLEHVRDTNRALGAIASILKPGGRALIFLPSRNAVYARLNLLLPERLKRWILFSVFPGMRRDHGFPAFYNRCTPRDFIQMGEAHGMLAEARGIYFHSDYFRFCFPLYVMWRAWTLLYRGFAGDQAAETFTLVLRKI